eukprot:jgi/Astpho2/4498/Aster-00098
MLVQQITGQDAAKVRELEVQVCSILQGNTGAISALRILHLYLERMGCDFQDLSQLSSMTGAALHMMGRAIFVPALRAYPPSLVAATLLYCARQNAGTPPLWPTSLIELTGYSGTNDNTFSACLKASMGLSRQDSPAGHFELPAMTAH